jgi:hypothetical protein
LNAPALFLFVNLMSKYSRSPESSGFSFENSSLFWGSLKAITL